LIKNKIKSLKTLYCLDCRSSLYYPEQVR